MVCYYHLLSVSLVLALPTIHGLKYTVTNNAAETRGGLIFDMVMGVDRAKSSMEAATYFIWLRVFDQEKEPDRREVDEIRLIIQQTMPKDCLYKRFLKIHEIHIKASYIENLVPEGFVFRTYFRKDEGSELIDQISKEDRVKIEIDSLVTFGIARALQWTAKGAIPTALGIGIAAFAVLESHHKPSDWVNAGEGSRWDESFDVTAQFFYYISKRKHHFVAELNKKMRTSYRDSYFEEAAGMTIDECWEKYMREYKIAV